MQQPIIVRPAPDWIRTSTALPTFLEVKYIVIIDIAIKFSGEISTKLDKIVLII
jgi:hypothetical protein